MNCLRLTRTYFRPNISKIISNNYATHHPIKFMEVQNRWRDKDNVSKRWELIYKAPMEKWLNYLSVYLTFSTTSITCGGLYYCMFMFDKSQMNSPVVVGEDIVLANNATECFVYIGAFIAFHVAVKILLSKYVIRMYQDGDNYLALFRGHTFNSVTKCQFHLKDFKKLKPTLFVSWGDARYSLGSKQAIIIENYFKTPEYFNYLLYKKSAQKPDNDEE